MKLFPERNETITGIRQQVQAGEISSVELVESCLARIDSDESEIHAWVLVDRAGALQRARELDHDLAAGRYRGTLHGIPIGIKDIVDVAGFPTAAGSELRGKEIVDHDAPLVANLKAAGAIILGKTVTTQFACFDPPITRNPWNSERTPGGSSSGSAAAVASGMCLAAIGSQTGGSITRPAAFCGVAGYKPTYGLVSTTGVVPISRYLDHPGPMARCVSDLALLADLLAQAVPDAQPWPSESIGDYPAQRLSALFPGNQETAPRIGRLRGFFAERAEPDMLTAFDHACKNFAAAGATLPEVVLPESFSALHRHHWLLMAADAATYHRQRFAAHPDDYLPGIRSLLEEGLAVEKEEYALALSHQETTRRDILSCFGDADVLASPAAVGTAPDPSTTGDPVFNAPWSYTGLPTISFPIALAADGLPLAIQLVGKPFGEVALFRAAAWCERIVREAFLSTHSDRNQ